MRQDASDMGWRGRRAARRSGAVMVVAVAVAFSIGVGCGGGGGGGGAATPAAVRSSDTRTRAQATSSPTVVRKSEPSATAGSGMPAGALFELRAVSELGAVLRPGVTMSSGDRFHLEVRTSRPSYIYVLYVDPAGQAVPLYPPVGEEVRVMPGAYLRLPPDGTTLELDDRVGTEQIYVIGSLESLEGRQDETAAAMRNARQGKRLAPASTPVTVRRGRLANAEASAAAPLEFLPFVKTRGVGLASTAGAVSGTPDPKGVAVVVFPIEHR